MGAVFKYLILPLLTAGVGAYFGGLATINAENQYATGEVSEWAEFHQKIFGHGDWLSDLMKCREENAAMATKLGTPVSTVVREVQEENAGGTTQIRNHFRATVLGGFAAAGKVKVFVAFENLSPYKLKIFHYKGTVKIIGAGADKRVETIAINGNKTEELSFAKGLFGSDYPAPGIVEYSFPAPYSSLRILESLEMKVQLRDEGEILGEESLKFRKISVNHPQDSAK